MNSKLFEIKRACEDRITEVYDNKEERNLATKRLNDEIELISKSNHNIEALYLFYKICEAGFQENKVFFLRGSISSLIIVALLNKTFVYADPLSWKLPVISALGKNGDKKLSLEVNCHSGCFDFFASLLRDEYRSKVIVPVYGHSIVIYGKGPQLEHHGFCVFDHEISMPAEDVEMVNGVQMLNAHSELAYDHSVIRLLTLENQEITDLVRLVNGTELTSLSDVDIKDFEFFDYQRILYVDIYRKNTRDYDCLQIMKPQNLYEYVDYLAAYHASYLKELTFEDFISANTRYTREDFGEAIIAAGYDEMYAYSRGIDIGISHPGKRGELLVSLDMEGISKDIVDEASRVLYLLPKSHVLLYSLLHYCLAYFRYQEMLAERGKA